MPINSTFLIPVCGPSLTGIASLLLTYVQILCPQLLQSLLSNIGTVGISIFLILVREADATSGHTPPTKSCQIHFSVLNFFKSILQYLWLLLCHIISSTIIPTTLQESFLGKNLLLLFISSMISFSDLYANFVCIVPQRLTLLLM